MSNTAMFSLSVLGWGDVYIMTRWSVGLLLTFFPRVQQDNVPACLKLISMIKQQSGHLVIGQLPSHVFKEVT